MVRGGRIGRFGKGECCSEGEIVTSDDKRQKDKPKLVPQQRSGGR
jgi:hypothetical protein